MKYFQIKAPVRFRIEGSRKAGNVIVQVAQEERARLIVMGSRGRGGLARALMGSSCDYVMNHANCAVLVVRE